MSSKKSYIALAVAAIIGIVPCSVKAETIVHLDRSGRNERMQRMASEAAAMRKNSKPIYTHPSQNKKQEKPTADAEEEIPSQKNESKPNEIVDKEEETNTREKPQKSKLKDNLPKPQDAAQSELEIPSTSNITAESTAKADMPTQKELQKQKWIEPPKGLAEPYPTEETSFSTSTSNAPIKTPVSTAWKAKKLMELSEQVDVQRDKIYDIIYYVPKSVARKPIAFYPTIIQDNTNCTVSARYNAEYFTYYSMSSSTYFGKSSGSLQSINFDTVSIRVNDKAYTIKYDYAKGHRNSGSSGVNSIRIGWIYSASSYSYISETYNELMDETTFAVFREIANTTKEVNVRFSGNDYEITQKMKPKLIKQTKLLYEIYELLKS